MSTPNRTPDPANDTALLAAGTIIVLATLGTYLALTLTGYGDDTTELLAFITPVAAALLVIRKVDTGTAKQDQVLAQIERQTNGELDRRIREGTKASLAEFVAPGGTVTGGGFEPTRPPGVSDPVPPRESTS